MGNTDDALLKKMILEKFEFVPLLTDLLSNQTKDDFPMKIVALRALTNFLS